MMWLRELLERAVLPARAGAGMDSDDPPKLMIVGHNFGARAAVAGTLFPAALKPKDELAKELPGH